jgi:hypothetical protein
VLKSATVFAFPTLTSLLRLNEFRYILFLSDERSYVNNIRVGVQAANTISGCIMVSA